MIKIKWKIIRECLGLGKDEKNIFILSKEKEKK